MTLNWDVNEEVDVDVDVDVVLNWDVDVALNWDVNEEVDVDAALNWNLDAENDVQIPQSLNRKFLRIFLNFSNLILQSSCRINVWICFWQQT